MDGGGVPLPVHPHAIWQAWFEIRGRRRPPMGFWAIPAVDLPDGTVLFDRALTETGDRIDPREVSPFDRAAHRALLTTTPQNRAWLEEMARRGVSGAWFHGIPHVLAPGPVALDRAHVVSWEVEPS